MQIHMIIRLEFRREESKAVKEEEMAPVEHFRETVGIVKEVLIVLLFWKWNTNTMVGIMTMRIMVIPIIDGIAL